MTALLRAVIGGLGLVLSLGAGPSAAHEVRPAYLEIRETAPETYDVLWKVPARGDAVLALEVRLPAVCRRIAPAERTGNAAAMVERWRMTCEGGLAGGEVVIDGLERTMIETIVRYERLDGQSQTARLMPGEAAFVADRPSTALGVARVYLPLGVDHILFGFDHLCFVLALIMLIGDLRRLVWTITAFTAAHSITLAAATLGWVSVPSGPVEAMIAFSIVLVAAEAVAVRRGHPGPTARRPWLVAFAFGLLHGLGFAGALSETGLPGDAIPLALLFFNIGVELGQIAFVLAVVAAMAALSAASVRWPGWARLAPAYAVGVLAAFWTIERTVGLVA